MDHGNGSGNNRFAYSLTAVLLPARKGIACGYRYPGIVKYIIVHADLYQKNDFSRGADDRLSFAGVGVL